MPTAEPHEQKGTCERAAAAGLPDALEAHPLAPAVLKHGVQRSVEERGREFREVTLAKSSRTLVVVAPYEIRNAVTEPVQEPESVVVTHLRVPAEQLWKRMLPLAVDHRVDAAMRAK